MRNLTFALATLALTGAAQAQDDGPFVTFEVLKPELALKMAEAAMVACRDAGYQVGVTVVDRFGIPQVFLRDRFAGAHVIWISRPSPAASRPVSARYPRPCRLAAG